jgi:hypothetical protein
MYVPAQVLYGTLVGTVPDASGAAVSGAAVTVTNRGTGQALEVKSDDTGAFTFGNVQPGAYDLKVTANGFRTFLEQNIVITTNTVRRVEVKLAVGAVTESVNVSASAITLQADKTDVSSELSSKEVSNMPLPRTATTSH